jgi:hypothetical protein
MFDPHCGCKVRRVHFLGVMRVRTWIAARMPPPRRKFEPLKHRNSDRIPEGYSLGDVLWLNYDSYLGGGRCCARHNSYFFLFHYFFNYNLPLHWILFFLSREACLSVDFSELHFSSFSYKYHLKRPDRLVFASLRTCISNR